MNVLIIAVGGAIGSVLRYGLATFVQRYASPAFPYGTFVVNLVGCAAFGLILGSAEEHLSVMVATRGFVLIGLLGGFTTFSAFSYDTVGLLRDGEILLAATNAVGQVALGICALWAGYALTAR